MYEQVNGVGTYVSLSSKFYHFRHLSFAMLPKITEQLLSNTTSLFKIFIDTAFQNEKNLYINDSKIYLKTTK
jgi:aspartyl/asparaginyl beta-hydroxylase (cupin superfamily)